MLTCILYDYYIFVLLLLTVAGLATNFVSLGTGQKVMMYLRQTVFKWTFAALRTSILQAGDVRLHVGLSIPLPVSGTGAQLLTEVLFNHAQVI